MKRNPLLRELSLRPLCCDGAMGTQLLARGLKTNECGMAWNVTRPGDVGAIHQAYRNGGCDLITTNSFGGTRFVLAGHQLAARVAELNRAAAAVARAGTGENGWVLGDVGPFGDFLEPLGDTTADDLRAAFRDQIAALIAGGADAILVETMVDPAEAIVGVEAAKSCSADVPVIVTYAFQKSAPGEFRTIMGTTVAEAVQRAIAAGADIVGTNCGTSLTLDDYVELGRQLVAAAGKTPVIVQPNAGSPRLENDCAIYDATPEQMAETALKLLGVGVRIIGGCCGTTPAHLAAMSRAIKAA
ncbi:MAG: homocysteine S-methyltransferase family protein [Verrucomicrobia bacterium]|nr:homocysteine S-methyltransferase family protein [Verrucomicrobiota bacterium]